MYEDFEARRQANRMFLRRNLPWIAPIAMLAGAGLFIGIGTLVAWLWRVTLVDVFRIKPISFWQAWGLLLLAQFLFKANVRPTGRTGRWGWHHGRHEGSPGASPEQPKGGQEL